MRNNKDGARNKKIESAQTLDTHQQKKNWGPDNTHVGD